MTIILLFLDAIALPDLDFFILMYIMKEATRSSEIEGTKAIIVDVIKSEAEIEHRLPQDVDRILHYIQAREFRISQNWIGGGSPKTVRFVPPPPTEMLRCLDHLEKFLYEEEYPPLTRVALPHAQFETIHPFLDGNGRTESLLTTFYLCKLIILERPELYLSDFFLTNQQAYYEALNEYHSENGEYSTWLDFFLDGVAIIAEGAIDISKKSISYDRGILLKSMLLDEGQKPGDGSRKFI